MTVTYTHEVADARLGGFSRLLLKWRGSVYKLFYKEFIIYMTLYTIISVVYRYQPSPEFKLFFEKLCLQFRAYTDQIPISFVLGFYVAIVVGRWWGQYLYVPWPDRMMVVICSTVHGADDRGRLIRRSLIRYLNLMQVLTYRSISTAVFKRFPTEQHVVDAGIMTKAEHKMINDVDSNNLKYWIPACWFSNLLSKTRQEGRILDDITYNKILEELNTFRGCCGMLLNYDWISVPLVYTQVVTVAVYMYFASCLLGSQYLDPEMHYDNHSIDLYVPIVTIGQFFFYVGWLKVAEQLINPFGEDDDDFEANWLIDRNLELSYLAVDDFYMKHPKLERDIWWGGKRPEAPYTAASRSHRLEPFMGSTFDMSLTKQEAQILKPEDGLSATKNTVLTLEVPVTEHKPAHYPATTDKSTIKSFAGKFRHKLKLTGIPLTQIREQSKSNERLLVVKENNESSDDDAATLSPVSCHENTDFEKIDNKIRSRLSSLSSNNEDEAGEKVKETAISTERQNKPPSSDDLSCSVARKKVRRDVTVIDQNENKNKRRTKKRTMRGKVKMSSEGDTEQERRNAVMRVRPELKAKKKNSLSTRRDGLKARPTFFNHQFPSDFSIPCPSSPSPKLLRWAFKSKNRTLYDDMISLTSDVHSDDQNDFTFSNRNLPNDYDNPTESNQSMPFTEDLRRRLQVHHSPYPTSPVHSDSNLRFNSATSSVIPSPTYAGATLQPIGEDVENKDQIKMTVEGHKASVKLETEVRQGVTKVVKEAERDMNSNNLANENSVIQIADSETEESVKTVENDSSPTVTPKIGGEGDKSDESRLLEVVDAPNQHTLEDCIVINMQR